MTFKQKLRTFLLEHSDVFENLRWLLTGGALTALIGFFATTIVARQLGPESFGILQYIFAVFFIIQSFENIIHPLVYKKLLIEDPLRESQLISAAIVGIGIYFVVCCLCAFGYLIWTGFDNTVALGVFILCLGSFFRISNPIAFFFDANSLSKHTSSNLVISKSSAATYRVSAAYVFPGILSQVFGQIVDFLVAFILHYTIFKRIRKKFVFNLNWGLCASIVRKSMPWTLLGFGTLLLLRIDQLILAKIANATELGIYSATVKLSEPWSIVSTALVASFYPKIVSDRSLGRASYYSSLRKLFLFLLAAGFAIGIITMVAGDFIVLRLLGEKYKDVFPVLRIHIWSNIFLFWFTCSGLWEIQEGRIGVQAMRLVTGIVVNVALNLYLVPSLGAKGAAFATVAAYVWVGFLFNACCRSTWPLFKSQIMSLSYISRICRNR